MMTLTFMINIMPNLFSGMMEEYIRSYAILRKFQTVA